MRRIVLEEINEIITVYAEKNGKRVDLRKLGETEQECFTQIITAFVDHINSIQNRVYFDFDHIRQCDT